MCILFEAHATITQILMTQICEICCKNNIRYSIAAPKSEIMATQLDWIFLNILLENGGRILKKIHLFTGKDWLKSFIMRNASMYKIISMSLLNLGFGDYKKHKKKWRECGRVRRHAQALLSVTQFISWQKLHRPCSRTHLRALMWKVKAIRLCEPPHIPPVLPDVQLENQVCLCSIKQVMQRFYTQPSLFAS